jgi:hypothetical protein
MRYFHRTSAGPDQVLEAARGFFGSRLSPAAEGPRQRTWRGATGHVTVSVRAEGGHYTLIEVSTDQVGESEIDKLAKRFLAEAHRLVEPAHEVRGAY